VTFRLTPPPAVLAPLVREAPSRLDPFRLDGPALVSFSGGRTSAYMLRRILDANGGRLPADVHAVFANTGPSRPCGAVHERPTPPQDAAAARRMRDGGECPVSWGRRDREAQAPGRRRGESLPQRGQRDNRHAETP
jgi:hypothetical protein